MGTDTRNTVSRDIRRHPDHKVPAPWSKTPMFLEEEDHPLHWYFLEHVLKRYSSEEDALFSKNLKILVAYPNLGLRSINSGRCIVIHHGHFVEPVYRIMSIFKTIWKEKEEQNKNGEEKKDEDDNGFPETIQKLEEENFSWIDFLWSTLVRSDDVGNQTEAIYEHMHNSEYTQKYISKKAETVAKKINIPIVPGDCLEKEGIELVLRQVFREFSKKEHRGSNTEINEEIKKGISLYLKTTEKQIIEECYEWTLPGWGFVFGYTHNPFEKQIYNDIML